MWGYIKKTSMFARCNIYSKTIITPNWVCTQHLDFLFEKKHVTAYVPSTTDFYMSDSYSVQRICQYLTAQMLDINAKDIQANFANFAIFDFFYDFSKSLLNLSLQKGDIGIHFINH